MSAALSAAWLVSLLGVMPSAWASRPEDDRFVLENAVCHVEFDRHSGSIVGIQGKGSGQLAATRGLADSFRLVLRGADSRQRTIRGRDQKLTVSVVGEGELTLTWDGPLVDTEGSAHKIRAVMKVHLSGSAAEFRLALRNDTDHQVVSVRYPMIGGLKEFAATPSSRETLLMLPTASPTIRPLALPFAETRMAYPGTMTMSYASVFNVKANRAVYFAAHDPVARLKHFRFSEEGTAADRDIVASIEHVPYTPAGKAFEGAPVVVRFHDGDWTAAGPFYRAWFEKAFGLMDPSRSWIRRHSFFVDTMFLLPEGTLNLTFKDIPRWAQDARDRGVTSLLISGWHRGGHDNGYPHYTPDPRLGTLDDLKRGLAACHAMGMRVYFFVNYQPAMTESDWFKRELNQYLELREDGGHSTTGWGMGTLWARTGHPKPMAWLDPSFPAYRDALIRQFLELVKAGADGVHVDKMFPGAMNFNPRCELGPDTTTWEGPIRLTRTLLAEARKINPDFAMSFETNWDRMLEFGNAIWWVGNMSLVRSVFPEMVETRAITSPYDYLGVNDAVRSSQAVLLGPLNYSRSLGWEPWRGLSDYIREVKRIQDRLGDAVFLGEVVGPTQVHLAQKPPSGIEYNVFRSLKTGRRVCILTSSGIEPRSQGIRSFAGSSGGNVRIHVPFAPTREARLPAEVTVPPEGIVFVEERETPASDASVPSLTPPAVHAAAVPGAILNGSFEAGDFQGWTADPNWRVDRNSCGAYRGWEGAAFAWSGGQGEAATGRLRSHTFVLDRPCVRLLIAGWNTMPGSGRNWNHVALRAADGTEIDRRSAPNSLAFVPVYLDGSGFVGKPVYLEAVDDADQSGWSMFGIDDVRTISLPTSGNVELPPLPRFDPARTIALENESVRVEVDRKNGAITRVFDRIGALELIREPRLAGNFRFTLPLPSREPWETIEANDVMGRSQRLSSFDIDRDGRRLTLRWQGPMTGRTGGTYDVAAVMGIELTGPRARLTLRIENRTPYALGEVFFPMLGGIVGLGRDEHALKATRLVHPGKSGLAPSDIFVTFGNVSPLGDQGPEQFFAYPQELTGPWLALENARLRRTAFLGSQGPSNRARVMHLEMSPGIAETPRWDGNWPRPEERADVPTGVVVSVVDFASHPPGKTYEAAPAVLQFHDGDARASQRLHDELANPQ
jgi:Domain of unknown function (DUF6259)